MIFFDIDGTLVDHRSASESASLALFDRFPGAIASERLRFPALWEGILEKHFRRFSRGEISLREQRRARMREVFARPDMPDGEADRRYRVFAQEYEGLVEPYEDAAGCLGDLAAKPLGIISNGARDQQMAKLRRAGFLECFSVMVYAEDMGFAKPAAGIFLEACRRAGRAPEACVYVGDEVETDVVPSRALGMRGIHLRRLPAGPRAAPPAISTLRDLPRLLE
ncbi:MAG: HAD family hydrolase [Acidobacteria bacterium]|nr:HAD family hydrolase [Acidobacteriota bacterium]